ncbi:MAG: NAD(P)-binding domain-containing protein [Pseudooceanicola sp.]|nr:NAD(P)-binding domain-containing protein [Pseudooceanicola sp.]
MRLGIIGVGHLSSFILAGLRRAGWSAGDVLLTPRGQGAALAARHGHALARDAGEVVDRCDLVLLAVRPAMAAEAVAGLPWRAGQVLVSACAGVPMARLAGAVAPARVVRVMPITAAAVGASPTVVWPQLPEVEAFLSAIGTLVPVDSEADFETATVSAAIYGWAQALVVAGAEWSAAQGLPPDVARQLVARTFEAAGRMQAEDPGPMREVLASLVTPGGITEAGLHHLEGAGALRAFEEACAVVLRRLR